MILKNKITTIFVALVLTTIANSLHAQLNLQKAYHYSHPSQQNGDIILQSAIENLEPRCIGPSGLGRINSISVVDKNPNIIFVGVAQGGVWRTINGGTTWDCLSNNLPTQNIGAVCVDQHNPAIVWLGTGDGFPRNTMGLGEGIFKSIDSGRTWTFMGLKETVNIHQILIDPRDPKTVFVGATGDAYKEHNERGVFKTIDGGKTWEKILFTNARAGCGELVMDPTHPDIIYAGMWEHQRQPWRFSSGGKGSGLYKSTDGGRSWSNLSYTNGLPNGEYGRIGIAVSRTDHKIVYVLLESERNGVYRSTNGGKSFSLEYDDAILRKRSILNRPFYFQKVACDPFDPRVIWTLGGELSKSEDGGRTFFNVGDNMRGSEFHGDHHAFYISPFYSGLMLTGDDGWLSISRDNGCTWLQISSFPTAQIYSVNLDNNTPYNVMGGLQDNGNWIGAAYTFSWGEKFFSQKFWMKITGGDGIRVVKDSKNDSIYWAMYQGGNLVRANISTSSDFKKIQLITSGVRYNWSAPVVSDPFNPNKIFLGSQFLLEGNGNGSWSRISADLSDNDSIKIVPYALALARRMKQDTTNFKLFKNLARHGSPAEADLSGAEIHCTITTISPSILDSMIIWVGTDDGNVQLTKNRGKSWERVDQNITGLPANSWISQITSSVFNKAEVIVVANNYRNGDRNCYVFQSVDYGKTWERIGKHVNEYALCVLQDSFEPGLLFLGTEKGLHVSADGGKKFARWSHKFPSVGVSDMKIHPKEDDLVLATFGRSFWVIDDISDLRQMIRQPIDSLLILGKSEYMIMKQETAIKNVKDNFYELHTTNRPGGIPVSVWIPSTIANDSVKVQIRHAGKFIAKREIKMPLGLNRLYFFEYDERDLPSGKYEIIVESEKFQVRKQIEIINNNTN